MEMEKQNIHHRPSKCEFIFGNGIFFIFGVIVVDACVEISLVSILITHLTEDGSLALSKAVSAVNVQDGTTAFLVLVVAYASDAYLGPFLSIVCTSLSYITGLWILYFAANSHSKSTDTEILYAAIVFIGLGRAGRSTSLKEFLGDQIRANASCEDEKQADNRMRKVWHFAYMLGILMSILIYKKSWTAICMISGKAMVVAFVLFVVGSCLYEKKKPLKGKKNNPLRVVYAAIIKRHLSHSHSTSGISLLRWLDKAAIVESSLSVEEQLKKARLCTVEQVEEVKSLLNMAPLCTTFLVYGLLQATGNTFFLEQAINYINYDASAITFVLIKTFTAIMVSWLCNRVLKSFSRDRNPNPKISPNPNPSSNPNPNPNTSPNPNPSPNPNTSPNPNLVMLVRIGVGVMISPICCLVAWRAEAYRLHNNSISMSFMWLFPQFFLLGLMQGLVFDGLVGIYSSLVPASLSKYGPSFAEFSLGIGHFLGLISVLIFRNLFEDTIKESRLGVYYRNLGFVCLVNLLFYIHIVPYYVKQEPAEDDAQVEQLETLEEISATS